MSPTIDPSKLKVTELREELQARGLDTKGNKPVLVKRLKKALEEELNRELPDTSIADTSTEDLDSSRVEDDSKSSIEPQAEQDIIESTSTQDHENDAGENVNNQDSELVHCKKEVKDEPSNDQEEPVESTTDDGEPKSIDVATVKTEVNEEQLHDEEMIEDQHNQTVDQQNDTQEEAHNEAQEDAQNETQDDSEMAQKGEKRKRTDDASPDRHQKKRERSPVIEDEPEIDPAKVLLSYYDSDLHLILDKKTFLSAKPLHEGLFGFAWAGVRATHGISSGKVRYEVKITEELKWEDFTQQRRERQEKAKEQREKERQKQEELKNKQANADANKEEQKDDANNGEEVKNANGGESTEAETIKSEESEEKIGDEKQEMDQDENTEKEDTSENAKSVDVEKENEKKVEVPMETEPEKPAEPILTHIFRTGWSIGKSCLQLGEDDFSYGYESTGKFVSNKVFKDFAATYKLGDVIGAYLNIDTENVEFRFTVNGELQSDVISIPRTELPEEDLVLFPHVLSRNYGFELNLGSKEEPWFSCPEELTDYPFLQNVEEKVQGATRPEKREDCEVLMMCGLPGSGKTHWVKEYLKSNAEKRITTIGCSQLLDRMKVHGQPLKASYNGRWNFLLEKLQRCLNRLCDIASQRRRNYIIDQPNVYPSAQRRKLRAFEGFKRRAVVVVVGDEEQAKRQTLKEAKDGKDVPDYALLEMKANMVLPSEGDIFDEVLFTDLSEEEAKAQVTKYNAEGRAAGYQPGQRRPNFRDDKNRWMYKRNDFHRGMNFRDHRGFQRFDRNPRGWGQPPPPGRFPRDRRPLPPPMAGGGNWMRNNRGPPRPGGDRNGRDNRQPASFNRSQRQTGGNRPGGWQSGGGYQQGGWGQQQQSGWGSMGGNQNWNASNYQQQSGGNWNANQWKQQGGYNQQGYGQNWNNYYGQYAQNWTGQAPQAAGSNQYNNQYAQWAQYAQQYAQGQNAKNNNNAAAPTAKK